MNDDDDIFIIPTLDGERFRHHEVPVELLSDLAAYRDLVLRIAKELYRQRYGRSRVPKGFEASFQLSLTEIREGSAALVLKRHGEQPPPPKGAEHDDWDAFAEARDEVEKFMAAVSEGKEPSALPGNVVPLFANIGKRLLDGEALKLRSPTRTEAVSYTPEVRKRIVLRWSDTYEREIELSGTVEAFDRDRGTFKVRDEHSRTWDLAFRPGDEPALTAALREHAFTRVELSGLATYDRNDQLKKLDIHELNVVEEVDEESARKVEARLAELQLLQRGWDDGRGERVSPDTADRIRLIILGLIASQKLPVPYLYPTHAGGVRAEWTFGPWEVSCEFEPLGRGASLTAINVETKALEEESVALEGAIDEELAVSNFVDRFKGAGE